MSQLALFEDAAVPVHVIERARKSASQYGSSIYVYECTKPTTLDDPGFYCHICYVAPYDGYRFVCEVFPDGTLEVA